MSMRPSVLPFSLHQSLITLLSRHWSLHAILAAWKVWLRLWLWVSSFSAVEPRAGRGWLNHLIFLYENTDTRQAIKSQKAQNLCSCSVSHRIFQILLNGNANLLLWFWTEIPKFLLKLGENKKNLQRNEHMKYHIYLESDDPDIRAMFSFFASPWMLPCSLLSVISVLKYAIITVFHCLMVSMHMSFSHSTENQSLSLVTLEN